MRTKAVPPPEVTIFPQYLREAGYYTTNNWFTDFQFDSTPTAFDDCSPTGHWRNRPTTETPFFAAFHGMTTHESMLYISDEQFDGVTKNVTPEQRQDPSAVLLPPYYPDTDEFRIAWARYLELIAEMDYWVGTLLDQLEEDRLTENTIVVFWSDHGLGMPRAKRWAGEAGFREPLIVRWPGILEGGTARTEVVQLLDLAPTLLAAAGVAVPEHMHGKPIFDANGRFFAANSYAFGARDRMMEEEDTSRSVRDSRYRYTRHLHPDRPGLQYQHYPDKFSTWKVLRDLKYDEASQLGRGEEPSLLSPLQRRLTAASRDPEELFDIVEDPHETTNLIDDPRLAGKRAELSNALNDWMAVHHDLGLESESGLIERWRPGGRLQTTEPPVVTVDGGALVAVCSTPGAAIGWTTEEPQYASPTEIEKRLGQRIEPHWNLYTTPVDVPDGPAWFRAWRLGFECSPIVHMRSSSKITTEPEDNRKH